MLSTMSSYRCMDDPLPLSLQRLTIGQKEQDENSAVHDSDSSSRHHHQDDQWRLWAEQSQRRRQQQRLASQQQLCHGESSPDDSLLKDYVDPLVERLMQFIDPTPTTLTKDNNASTMIEIRHHLPKHSNNSNSNSNNHRRAGTADFLSVTNKNQKDCRRHHNHYSLHNKGRQQGGSSSACSTMALSESSSDDDLSSFETHPPLVASRHSPCQFDQKQQQQQHQPRPDFKFTQSFMLEQQAIMKEVDKNSNMKQQRPSCNDDADENILVESDRQNELSSSSSSTTVFVPQQKGTSSKLVAVKLLSNNRIKRAMQRGESIRLIQCTACHQELFVTPDVALVYCPQCESLSSHYF